MQLQSLALAFLRLLPGCQHWTIWHADSPHFAIPDIPVHNPYHHFRRKRSC